jgi:hypothetical protein
VTSHEAWIRTQILRFGLVLAAAKRHLPKWMIVVIGIALCIPGPQDELFVALLIAGWAIFKPRMRHDISEAWNVY